MAKNDVMTNASCKNEVEALLFSAGKNMTVDTIAQIIGTEKGTVLDALGKLKEEYNSRDSALMIMDEGDLWKIHVREKFLPIVQKIVADTELPKSVLETLAVIAFKSPTIQSEVINTRSSVAYEHIGLLLDMGFITREKKGRSFVLKVTDKFFDYFDIAGDKSLKDMLKKVPGQVGEKEVEGSDEGASDAEDEGRKIPYQRGIVLDIPHSGTADPDKHKEESLKEAAPNAPADTEESKADPAQVLKVQEGAEGSGEEDEDVPELLKKLDKEIDEMTKKKNS